MFRDDGYSGTTLRRPGLDALRDAVASAEVERVFITAPDRLARKYVHQVLLLEELERFCGQLALENAALKKALQHAARTAPPLSGSNTP